MVGVLLVAFAAGCGGDGGAAHNPGALYPDRANQYREDQERRIGEPVRVGGYTATVTEARVDDASSMLVSVEITNEDDEAQRVDATHWTLVNPRVQTIEATSASFPGTELDGGVTWVGEVTFSVDASETGHYYIQYKPEALDAARGIWRTEIPPVSGR
jgi:hypothetical protein